MVAVNATRTWTVAGRHHDGFDGMGMTARHRRGGFMIRRRVVHKRTTIRFGHQIAFGRLLGLLSFVVGFFVTRDPFIAALGTLRRLGGADPIMIAFCAKATVLLGGRHTRRKQEQQHNSQDSCFDEKFFSHIFLLDIDVLSGGLSCHQNFYLLSNA